MATLVYSPKDYTFSFGGVTCGGGFAEGDGIKVTMNSDNITIKKGIDGQGMGVRSADDSATVELTLLKTASYNSYLSGLMLRQRLFSVPAKPIQVISLDGGTVFHGDEAWISKEPEMIIDKDGKENVWTFVVVSGRSALAGGIPQIVASAGVVAGVF